MGKTTPRKSRSDINRRKQDVNNVDVAVNISCRGKTTISGRRFVKKLKWPTTIVGFFIVVLFMPKVDIQLTPEYPQPVQVHTQQ
ncbi:hypothetical protein ACIBJI_40010 [Nocardia sp. NPDC050408]|uniref:hypothetical protein n=1 Tax=Nocardia sp. NPDC050408 TaxID=3364319 RepID=UPI0037900E7E